MNLYLITGKAGSGKDYLANKLKERLDNVVITRLSKYIKIIAIELGLWDGNEDNKPREFLQNTGDLMRAIDTNFLTKRILDDIKIYKELGINNVIISDVRLINEINYLKSSEYNVITIRVNSDTSNRVLTDSEKNHITETELDNYNDFDYIVDRNNIDNIIEEIVKGR